MALHRLHHRLNRLGRDFVGEVRGHDDVVVVAQLAVDLVIQQDVVEDRGEHQRVAGVRLEEGREGALAQVAVGMAQQGHDFAVGEFALFPVHAQPKAQGAGELLVQLLESFAAGEVLLIENLLLFFTQGVGLEAPQRFEVVPVLRHLRRGQEGRQPCVVQGDQLEREKDEHVGDRGGGFARALEQLLGPGVLRVGGEE